MGLEIKKAGIEELSLVNHTYKSIQFLPSTLNDEIIAIAYVDGVKVGLGRVAVVDEHCCELGGMYVEPNFRGQKIARRIVEFLLENAQCNIIYCIPFERLLHFYKSFGFRETEKDHLMPIKIQKKLEFTREAYSEPTSLLIRYK